jgi:Methyltransferase domain
VRHADEQLGLNERARALSSDQLFNTIGTTYAAARPADPRIAARICAALGDAHTVLNVGAGTGAYEPSDREVTAVEPSAVMRAQRPAGAAPCVSGVAGSLPFADKSFDAAMAVSTDQHWPDAIAGYREMQRVARRVVTFHFDISRLEGRFWLIRDYMPEHAQLSAGRPTLTERASAIGARLEPVFIPWDCRDGNFPSYWRRPEAYLDEQIRRPVSVWHLLGRAVEERVVRDLRADLESGRWAERNSELLDLDEIDLGGRLLIA